MELIKESAYKYVSKVTGSFEIYINRRGYHWRLLARLRGSELPYITLEITTEDMTDLIPITDTVEEDDSKEMVGEFQGTLQELSRLADQVRQEMKAYNVVTSNCQHFCNNVLKTLGLTTYPTTVGPETTLTETEAAFDSFSTVFPDIQVADSEGREGN